MTAPSAGRIWARRPRPLGRGSFSSAGSSVTTPTYQEPCSSGERGGDLVHDHRGDVGERVRVAHHEGRPSPALRLALDGGDGAHALAGQHEEGEEGEAVGG